MAADGAEWRFLLVGPADPVVLREALAFVDRHGLRDRVRFLGRRPAGELHDIVSLADLGVNLRHPTMGESSAALMNLLACGCPALVTAEGQFLEYPDDVCWKVDAGGGERRQLVEMMRTLRERPEVLAAMGRAARHFAEARAWPVAGQAYGDLIRELAMARDGAAEYRPPVVLGR